MSMNNENNDKPAREPGNDVFNGIERWIPQPAPGKSGVAKSPKGFAYKSPTGIWYRSVGEAHAAIGRCGMEPAAYVPVLTDLRDETASDEGPDASEAN